MIILKYGAVPEYDGTYKSSEKRREYMNIFPNEFLDQYGYIQENSNWSMWALKVDNASVDEVYDNLSSYYEQHPEKF